MIDLQGYDISISASDMRPTKAGAHEMVIPICELTVGIIEGL